MLSWFNKKSVGKRIGIGFGIILVILGILAIWSYSGIKTIVHNASEVIDGNKLRGEMAQREVDHLNWVNKVNKLLNDETVHSLDCETDPHKCAFGKWYYGEGRQEAEKFVKELKTPLKEIEKYHNDLHGSAAEIKKNFKQADSHLPALFAEKMVDHLNWSIKLRESLTQESDDLGVQTDPHKCALGKWLASDTAKKAYRTGDADFKKTWNEMLKLHQDLHKSASNIAEYTVFSEHKKNLKDKTVRLTEMNKQIKELFAELDDLMGNGIDPLKNKAYQDKDDNLARKLSKLDEEMNESIVQQAFAVQLALTEYMLDPKVRPWESVDNETTTFNNNFKKWLVILNNSPLAHREADIKKHVSEFNASLSKFKEVSFNATETKKSIDKAHAIFEEDTLPILHKTLNTLVLLKQESEHELNGMLIAKDIYAKKTVPSLVNVQRLLGEISETTTEHIMTDAALLKAARDSERAISILSVFAVVIGVIIAISLSLQIARVLREIIISLQEGSEQVSSASGQVSSASQSIAEGASQQASSLEETSASLEEMSSMTAQNADSARDANALMENAKLKVDEGSMAMQEMSTTINEIKRSSDETAKIIRTINEIASQTNLLALNAAVEAARAGEAGKGFAVVAEEVRNLAQRSAQAAKDTANMIDQSQKSAEGGVKVTEKLNNTFADIQSSIEKSASLIAEIASATKEQAEGVNQINTAISQMDSLTQANAANSEEAAAASEELSAQATELGDMVDDLVTLVEGFDKNKSERKALPQHGHSELHKRQLQAPNRKQLGTGRH